MRIKLKRKEKQRNKLCEPNNGYSTSEKSVNSHFIINTFFAITVGFPYAEFITTFRMYTPAGRLWVTE